MPNLKHRYVDQTLRLIRRHLKFEICVIDEVIWHKEPGDDKFNTVKVLIRDRPHFSNPDDRQYLPCLQGIIGRLMGVTWSPRVGDLVLVWFYSERKGIVLGSAWNWAQYPICRPTPYDIAIKIAQWMKPKRHPQTGDFCYYPYPDAKKPFCFRWFHGPVTGTTGKGRDLAMVFDYCRQGDGTPDCRNCKLIDSIERPDNHYFKMYSAETESKKAHPLRGEWKVPCGSYLMFDSKCCEDCEECGGSCCSEIYTDGKGYWRLQGATDEQSRKGHVTHHPTGTTDMHSGTCDPSDECAVRCMVVSPDDDRFEFAFEAKDFDTGAYIRIMKNGDIKAYSPGEIHMKADEKITLEAPLIDEITELVHNHGNQQIDGSCTHGPCSCS